MSLYGSIRGVLRDKSGGKIMKMSTAKLKQIKKEAFTLNDAKNDITIEDGTIEGNGATPVVIEFIAAS